MLTATLHPYQVPAVDLFLRRGNALFAMGTGTGKTVSSIAAAEELLGCGDVSTVLVVCPASLKYQWAKAISQFTDIPSKKISIKKQTITIPRAPHGVVIDGKAYQQNGVKYSAADDRKRQYDSITSQTDYVIVGYDNITDDSRQIRRIKPGLVILDEATVIKNPGANITQHVRRLLDTEYKIALTATPIENALEELFFILEWVDEDFLGPWEFFEKAYIERNKWTGQVTAYKNTEILFEKLKEIMYRKTREDPDVAPYMPEPMTDEWLVELDGDHWNAYAKIALDLLAELKAMPKTTIFDPAAFYSGQLENTAVGRAMAMHMAAEMLLDHPDLVARSGQQYEDSERQRNMGIKRQVWPGSKYAYMMWRNGLLDSLISSPKLELLALNVWDILRNDQDAKVIIFTKYKPMLEIIERKIGGRCAQYHGEMTPRQKEASVTQFTSDPACRVFLSSHAGAYGRDLYMANHLVNVDQPPSAGRAEQIDGRHVRASSEFAQVWIHNMVVTDTIEERNTAKLQFKKTIGGAYLDGKGRGTVANRVESLTAFLERTVGSELDSVRPFA